MSQSQYLKMLEREIQKINKKIDLKIMEGTNLWRTPITADKVLAA